MDPLKSVIIALSFSDCASVNSAPNENHDISWKEANLPLLSIFPPTWIVFGKGRGL